MDRLLLRLRAVRMRCFLDLLLGRCAWWVTACLIAAAVLVTVDRLAALTAMPWWSWPLAAVGCGLIAGSVSAWRAAPDLLGAAADLDRRLGLRERVASAIGLDPHSRETPMGQALIADAARSIERPDWKAAYPLAVRPKHVSWLLPAAAAVAAGLWVPPLVGKPQPVVAGLPEPSAEAKRLQDALQAERKKLEEQKQKAATEGLQDAESLLAKLEKELAEQNAKPQEKRETLIKLNDLADKLKEQREKLGAPDAAREKLDKLKQLGDGPAEKLGQALREGDFKQAAAELEKLKNELAGDKSKLSPDERAKAEKQLGELGKKLAELAKEQQEAKKNLQAQADQARGQGNEQALKEALKQLDKLAKQDPQMQQLGELAKQLGECSECLNKGQGAAANAKLAEAKAQLEKLAGDAKMQQMMRELEDQLADLKDKCNGQCEGDGPGKKPGGGQGQGQGQGQGNGQGQGLGAGRGEGARPEKAVDTKTLDRQVRQRPGEGPATVTGFVDGPNVKGSVAAQVRSEMQAGRRDEADAGDELRLPPGYRRHLKDYFDALRE